MRLYRLIRVQYLPISIEKSWDFFSNPINLSTITPSWLSFKLTQKVPKNIHAGMIISYHLTPLPYLPVNWITEITHLREPEFFVDEQRFGPYRFWHHQHIFKTYGDGTEMTDIVHYALGYGFAGDLINRFIVSPRLKDIFDYRHEKLTRLFNSSLPKGKTKDWHVSKEDAAVLSG
jgi:ligand-binding SRPBCC domain-containing protein